MRNHDWTAKIQARNPEAADNTIVTVAQEKLETGTHVAERLQCFVLRVLSLTFKRHRLTALCVVVVRRVIAHVLRMHTAVEYKANSTRLSGRESTETE